ncbi:sigma-54-dependent transcriptional regulator [Arenimonas terrae]|uniref:Sigma-54-dependent Fis family transcriptional regulator n=1 Tax=Arenimonas terrae TaxID=2546226 RepID=A0A5C4RRS5_9GAMM|nr:sigma-54 dependent transcriptional regulator [Arenimonas terrae]TNJ33257.1 sigma-54-dependent Fis family transcriptional regulator [Arenimonas terrae]
MTEQQTLFIVDDDVGFVHAAAELAREQGFIITVAGSVEQALTRLKDTSFDVALIDLSLPDGSGLELLEHLDLGGSTQVILITGHPTVESALKAMHLPIVDYVVKPLRAAQFTDLLQSAAKQRRVVGTQGEQWHGLAGPSAAMADVRQQICRVAPTDASVFIEGESGVGKELVAGAIHAESGRTGPFVALNCGAVPAELLTSQLFGHERGSFTGANSRHVGLFEQAQGGTLFLDELTEMPIHLQVHLLRALETRTIRRVGGSEDIPVDVRVISATNRPHAEAIEAAKLREDLYYRLAEFPMTLPSLRERPEDVLPIADLFLQRLNERYGTRRALSKEGADRLQRYSWPGNIRELKNIIQRSYILADGDLMTPTLPTGNARPLAETESTITFAVGTPMHEIERRMLFKTLAFFENNKAKAAQALGVTTKTIYNRLTAYQSSNEPRERTDERPDTPSRCETGT